MDEDSLKALVVVAVLVAIFLIFRYAVLTTQAKKKYSETKNSRSLIGRAIRNSKSMIKTNYGKVKKYAERNISKSYLTGCTWILINKD
ncbi:hypothetical protein LB467_18485 [Salegentibacter sp. JZCK2]|uniref:hypothetical protein n=1 Tax=Salegentibacter tibetensis TaxID=2873600 RepID=UPI001CCB7DCC|nr:hypothetical protein [Salegentibacter tibetensis]MBZ9731675.1 hypothetical protein [Salegentibacter tibetensis]